MNCNLAYNEIEDTYDFSSIVFEFGRKFTTYSHIFYSSTLEKLKRNVVLEKHPQKQKKKQDEAASTPT